MFVFSEVVVDGGIGVPIQGVTDAFVVGSPFQQRHIVCLKFGVIHRLEYLAVGGTLS